jgi:hypothetical protein
MIAGGALNGRRGPSSRPAMVLRYEARAVHG